MRTSTVSSRAHSTSTRRSDGGSGSADIRCASCGATYGRRAFQIVAIPSLTTFDRVDCAVKARAPASAAPSIATRGANVIAEAEQLAAQLFAARIELARERMRVADLSRALAARQETTDAAAAAASTETPLSPSHPLWSGARKRGDD